MRTNQLVKTLAGWTFGSAFVCVLVFTAISCRAPQPSAVQRGPSPTDPAPYGPYPQPPFQETRYAELHTPVPEIAGAEYINDDSLCMTCHETFVKTFQHNVHRDLSCEKCHGPASRHLQSRGKVPGTILSFKTLSAPSAPKSASSVTNRMLARLEPNGGRRRMPRMASLAPTATPRTTTCPLARQSQRSLRPTRPTLKSA